MSDWRPSATQAALIQRAQALATIRGFFAERGVLEVETPILSPSANPDPAIQPPHLAADLDGIGGWYLNSSPELAMKRLLAASSGAIYQLCKVFRGGERGRWHHPEFTLLEWYRPGWMLDELIDEVADLIRCVLKQPTLAVQRIGYRALFIDHLGLDPWHCAVDQLQTLAMAHRIGGADSLQLNVDGWLDLLLSHCLQPDLGRGCITVIADYPPSQAALAQLRHGEVTTAARFECYVEGLELANGYHELADWQQQRQRFLADLAQRKHAGEQQMPMDEHFFQALAHGLPDSVGVALGVDRLIALALGAQTIDQVVAFTIERA